VAVSFMHRQEGRISVSILCPMNIMLLVMSDRGIIYDLTDLLKALPGLDYRGR
jgi:hypothetical protein